MKLLSLKHFKREKVINLLQYHLDLKDMIPHSKIYVDYDYVELDFDDMLKSFEENISKVTKYTNSKELFRDFEDYIQDEDILYTVAQQKMELDELDMHDYLPGDITQADFLM